MTDSANQPKALLHWHEVVTSRDPVMLSELLADDATFHSPVLFQPQRGRDLTALYLVGAMHVLANDSFRYVRELSGDRDAVLEFTAEVDGIHVNGIDMITWDDNDQITDFKVMLRPFRAIQLVQQKMAELLQAAEEDHSVDKVT